MSFSKLWNNKSQKGCSKAIHPINLTHVCPQKCAQAASSLGHTVFAVSNGGNSRGGECYSSCEAALEFAKYGRATNCAYDGTGGWKKMNVYSLDGKSEVEKLKHNLLYFLKFTMLNVSK